ncbi:MAG: trigger factor [Patescibacteria group bacterium]|jgi:trigger factor|nr:trigger factor [Patescibacteria group bacterium]
MKVDKKKLEKSQIEISVSLSLEEFKPYLEEGAKKLSETVKIEGFRPGKAPYDVIKSKVGEMSILEEAAQSAVSKTVDQIILDNSDELKPVGTPSVEVTKLAPENPFEFKVTISLLPDIELGKYKDLGLEKEEAEVDDKKVEKTLNDLAEMRATEELSEKEVEDGDKVTVDIKISLGNVPIENGQHKDLAIILGKDYLLPGFDKKILGAKAGDELNFELVYPEKHHQKNLAGKKANFEVKVKGVYQRNIPKVDDDMAKEMQFKNLSDLKKALIENLKQEKLREVELKMESEMLNKIIDDSKIGEIPDVLIESETKNILAELEQNIARQGGKFEDYLKSIKKTKEELSLEMTPNAIKRVKSALIIREIAVVENIDVSDKEVQDKIDEVKEKYKDNPEVEKMTNEEGYRSYVKNILNNEKVLAKLKEWNYVSPSAK